ncbi:MAG TPA: chemotaxis protein CheW [Kofleriaceae bacterium]|nr:chemotaxis protein CheW [Kofleriaceae bacterium]
MSLHVSFRVGTADYALPAAEVLHLESFETATHVPGAPAHVAGLVQVRGRVVPVVDLRVRFGLPAIERTLDSRVVVIQHGKRVAGLLVDSAREVLNIDEAMYEKPPSLIEQQAQGFVKAVATVTKRLYLLPDVPRIIGEEELVHA